MEKGLFPLEARPYRLSSDLGAPSGPFVPPIRAPDPGRPRSAVVSFSAIFACARTAWPTVGVSGRRRRRPWSRRSGFAVGFFAVSPIATSADAPPTVKIECMWMYELGTVITINYDRQCRRGQSHKAMKPVCWARLTFYRELLLFHSCGPLPAGRWCCRYLPEVLGLVGVCDFQRRCFQWKWFTGGGSARR